MIAASTSNLLAAREQMAFTLAFHIPFACMGIAFPLMVLIANWLGVRGDGDALTLAQRWSKVMAVTFAVGAVTGTVLSFELGLLWPGMMARYGDVFGIPFGIEGIFFFTEAIFIAIYIYGWKRLPPKLHLLTAVPIVIAGIGGAFAVVAANSWMNQPGGFTEQGGQITSVNPWQVFFNHAAIYEMPHMILAAYMVAGFLVAAFFADSGQSERRIRHRTTAAPDAETCQSGGQYGILINIWIHRAQHPCPMIKRLRHREVQRLLHAVQRRARGVLIFLQPPSSLHLLRHADIRIARTVRHHHRHLFDLLRARFQ